MKFSLVTSLVADLNVVTTTTMSLHKRHAAFVEEESYVLEVLLEVLLLQVLLLHLEKVVKVSVPNLPVEARPALQRVVVAHQVLERVAKAVKAVKAGVCRCDTVS